MARKKRRKLAFAPDAQPQSGDSGNHVSWFGSVDRLTDSSSRKVGDTSNDPLTGRNILTGAQEVRHEGAASQPMTPAQAFADAVLHGDSVQIKATYDALPHTLATAKQVTAAFTAMPQDQRDTVVKNVDANAEMFGPVLVSNFKMMIQSVPPATRKTSTDPVDLTGQEALDNLGMAGSGKGLGSGASNQAHLSGVDTRLVAAWDYAAAKTGERYSLVGPRSGTRSVEDAKKNAAAGIGVEHSLHIADKSGVGHAGDLYVNGKTPGPAFAAAVKEYAGQNGYQVRWGGTDFRLPNGNRDPNHFDLGTRVGGVAFKAGAADPAAVEVAMARAPAAGGFIKTMMGRESYGGKNVTNVDATTSSGRARGVLQITDGTWKDFAPAAVLAKYPTALQAPPDVQMQVAGSIPLGRWDKSTLAALRGAGYTVDPNATLAENVAANRQTMIAGAGGQDVTVGGDRSAGGAAALAAGIGNHGLRKGSGDAGATRALQSALNDLGATDRFGNALKVDGRFGNRTYEAVKNYQADAGIPDDGIVGPQTFKHISGDMADASFGVHVGTEGSPELRGQLPDPSAQAGPRFFAGPGPGAGPTARDYAAGMAVAAVTVDPVVSRAVRIPTGLDSGPVPADHPLRAQIEHVQNVSHWLDSPPSPGFDNTNHSAFSSASDPYRPTGGSNGSFTGAVSGGSSSSGSYDSFAAGMSHTYQTVQSGGSVAPQPSYSVGGAGVYTPTHVSTVNDGYSPPTTFTTGNNGQIVGGI